MTPDTIRTDIIGTPAEDRGPTALRIMVGTQLRKLREARKISPQQAGERIRGSHAKISRLELGRTGYKERDIVDLLDLYGVDDPLQRDAFLKLVRKANEQGWWHGYSDLLPAWFENYLGLEGAAKSIRTFEAQLVPGLLQTEDYARAVVSLAHNGLETARRVELRRERQKILEQQTGPTLWAILDESVLRRTVGGNEVMRAQIQHLIRMAEHPSVSIQVLPYTAGGHTAVGCSFTILRFAEPELPDIVYIEQLQSAQYLDRPTDLDLYRQVMDQLSLQADSPTKTLERLRAAEAELAAAATESV
ncbi:helix-turn-helix domain-containing protein [Nocardia sp. alder85J]|uniref:helix-turn-helix domain-containing protein n=1 Tax=Nocardia sp. alder85J TaxID=2862949 RepID=UPI001CD648DA|nr:helix-turn-helix transcriptional regulator [Nocardia sp. alder85J]MCX4097497.1 helix-turn-helix transcriptional regulator [Nocardia sp. alder85J]